jgi:hypothetical protein
VGLIFRRYREWGNQLEEDVWNDFANNPDKLAQAANAIRLVVTNGQIPVASDEEEDGVAEAEEGRILTRLHRSRERSRELIEKKKAFMLRLHGCLKCEAVTMKTHCQPFSPSRPSRSSSAPAVGVFAQAQIAHHLQLGEADVLAVEVRDQVTDPDERNEPAGDLLDDLRTADARAWRMIHGVLSFSEARCLQARYFLSVGARKTAPAS